MYTLMSNTISAARIEVIFIIIRKRTVSITLGHFIHAGIWDSSIKTFWLIVAVTSNLIPNASSLLDKVKIL